MSKPLHLALHCHWHPNGLLLVHVTGGDYRTRRVLTRATLTYDPEEGRPTSQKVLQDAVEAVCRTLGQS